MTKERKTRGKPFPKGVSGNPEGRPPLPVEVRKFREASKELVIEEFKYLWSLPASQVKDIAADDKQPVIRKFIAAALSRAAESGDMGDIDPILNRVIGKVPAEIKGDLDLNHNFHKQLVDFIHGIEREDNDNEDQDKEDDEENIN